ncbi:phospholipid/cholesterol/gamma-HCH transport system permease protein [Altererythrobacter atlanticus]|uniref:Phospholipid ABC transporter permease protein MlaE n=1 Tax=Croceibacterium atlanticum TaxID=1267766 RepID=A0A0F7KTK8_9SPHN|nr:ABC transporter permease [Croceibacterium atlanticum]AKH42476.1 putative phospholipid ABC transporter permease protein MlaE [Croceibacterium atlanticum]MBB5731253.1 phospholipid/cholesterol/gamma-HCH transport system permease protein [Croceibacterium atlanticum]
MRDWADFSVEEAGGRTTVAFEGPFLISTVARIDGQLRAFEGPVQFVDISNVGAIDTVGAWLISRFADRFDARIEGASEQAQTLLNAVSSSASEAPIRPERKATLRRVLEDVGDWTIEMGQGVVRVVGFLGAIIASAAAMFIHPRRFRLRALVRQMELVGLNSLGIIGLMSFLIGIVIAQQGAVQLAQFGAETLTVNLVGRITLRELGVLMTAIMVAGRSGSAFAAQIGTMKLTEEIDAMRTIGVSPMEALVLPRILAAVLMMPLLGFYSSVVAIIGGAVVSDLTLGIPFMTFLSRIQEVVPLHDLYIGVVKAPVFGLIVALAGCYQGMQVSGNAEEVGLKTTKAVVQAIFMVIVLDAFFAVFFTEIGWG